MYLQHKMLEYSKVIFSEGYSDLGAVVEPIVCETYQMVVRSVPNITKLPMLGP